MAVTPPAEVEASPTRFHGPVMVGVAVVVTLASLPGQTVIVGLFNAPLRESLGLSVTGISMAYTIGTLAAAGPLVLVGRLADRLGVRATTGLIAAAFAAALALTGLAGGVVALTAAFFALRLLGQGSLGMLGGHILAMWYERRLGLMEAVRHVAMSLGSGVAPLIVAPLIAALGWRTAMAALGAVVALTVQPLVFTVFRSRPEDVGQHLDGDPAEHEAHDVLHGGPPPPGDPAFTVTEALATRAYWTLVPVMVASGVIGTALLFHMQTLLESIGADPADAPKAVFPWPIATAAAALAGGWLADRVRAWKLLPIGMALLASSCLVIWSPMRFEALARWEVVGAGMLVFGLSMGLTGAVANPAIARYFGRTHHGGIRGTVTTAMVAGTGAGPILAGWIYEGSGGSFAWLLLGSAAVCVPLGVLALTLRPPEPPGDSA